MAQNLTLKVLIICFIVAQVVESKRIHYIHWNKANPMFRLDNTDHIVDVNSGNLPWEYDQVNIICPVSKPNVRYPERHVIYSVSREEFDSCRITNPKPKIVAVCSQPHQLLYFTITFRSFTPTPGGLEFYPGQDYYFISTSSKEDLHRRVGGGCSTHNMKMIFRVADNGRAKLIRQEEERRRRRQRRQQQLQRQRQKSRFVLTLKFLTHEMSIFTTTTHEIWWKLKTTASATA
jgi:hypothetical protein